MARINIFWFRRDLRLLDNSGFVAACQPGFLVLPIFIVDPYFYESWEEVGALRVRFLYESLQDLDRQLKSMNSKLFLIHDNSVEAIQKLCTQLRDKHQITLFFNRDRQIEYGLNRDRQIVDFAKKSKLPLVIENSNFLLLDEEEMPNWREKYYQYQKQPIAKVQRKSEGLSLLEQILADVQVNFIELDEFAQKYKHFLELKSPLFTGGSSYGQQVLQDFLDNGRHIGYHWKLSRPEEAYLGSTSHLSPHIMWGTLSVRQINQAVRQKIEQIKDLPNGPKLEFSLKAFLDRLRWRESFSQRLYFHPHYEHQNWYSEFDEHYNWNLNAEQTDFLEKWRLGETGFLLVDAAMKQLKTVGWLNFRMRAMCATFLTINCGVSWHWGARHFMQTLVDGDVAIDSWQWQMQAGITNPLQNSFRIYNPDKNLKEKDSNCQFVKRWLPELADFTPEIIQNYLFPKNLRPTKILDFEKTKRQNGKKLSEIRKLVKQRLLQQNNSDTQMAKIQQQVCQVYYQIKNQKYLDTQMESLF